MFIHLSNNLCVVSKGVDKVITCYEKLSVIQRSGDQLGTVTNLLEKAQMHDKAKAFARIVLLPGSKVAFHKHVGRFEAIYILAGLGVVNDNGNIQQVKVGDVIFTDVDEGHSIENVGDVNLEYIALVINS